jgi:hypothetical protein
VEKGDTVVALANLVVRSCQRAHSHEVARQKHLAGWPKVRLAGQCVSVVRLGGSSELRESWQRGGGLEPTGMRSRRSRGA